METMETDEWWGTPALDVFTGAANLLSAIVRDSGVGEGDVVLPLFFVRSASASTW